MSSSPTDFIGEGQNYFFDLANTTSFNVYTYDYNEDGQPNAIAMEIQTSGGVWDLDFGTNSTTVNLTPGFYANASSGPSVGEPFTEVSGDGRGDAVTGEFTVLYSSFPPVTPGGLAPTGSSFAITFTQTCCGIPTDPNENGTLYGTLYYNYTPTPEPNSVILLVTGFSILAFLSSRKRKREMPSCLR
jgi:hypothetical protein